MSLRPVDQSLLWKRMRKRIDGVLSAQARCGGRGIETRQAFDPVPGEAEVDRSQSGHDYSNRFQPQIELLSSGEINDDDFAKSTPLQFRDTPVQIRRDIPIGVTVSVRRK